MVFKIYLPIIIFFTDSVDYLDLLSPSRNSSYEAPSTSESIIHPADYDTGSNTIEEVPRKNSDERRERSFNKLTRTLGEHPLTIMEDRQTTQSPGSNSHHQWDSFGSDSMILLESDALSSFMSFAPASMASRHHHPKRTPTSHTTTSTSSDVDSSFTTTSTREEEEEQNSVPISIRTRNRSHSSPIPEPSSLSSLSSRSRMPHLHISTHTDAVSDPYDLSPADSNEPVQTKSDWLVPLNEVVISIRRNAAPSKPQSWTGEWNREMKDVIRDLRRL